jgi:plasmid stabilization system protein ParE
MRHSAAALRWHKALKEAIPSLGKDPNRCPLTRKTGQAQALALRPKPHLYGVIYRVLEKAEKPVEVLHIRPFARRKSDLG